jgi:hypothetical protein
MIESLINVVQLAEWEFVGKTKVLAERLPPCHFVHQSPKWPDVELNPGHCCGKAVTNSLTIEWALQKLQPYAALITVQKIQINNMPY